MYNGGTFSMFYKSYSDLVIWNEQRSRFDSRCNLRNLEYQELSGTGFGEYGLILDAHILAKNCIFTQEGQAITGISNQNAIISTSFLNSVVSQYILNVIHSGLHKVCGYINLLPMPEYASKVNEIIDIINEIIGIKRYWFSFDETNLEYRGVISQLAVNDNISKSIDNLQTKLEKESILYYSNIDRNDNLWMDLANIKKDSDLFRVLSKYKEQRLYEELLSIDNCSTRNVINKKVMAQEIVMELVGMAFGRWDADFATGKKTIPEFSDVFDALPFMPVVSCDSGEASFAIPEDGILTMDADSPLSLTMHVRDVMRYIWDERADDIEYELCQLIGCKNLQNYLESPTGFFDYHFKRYTKSRRKAPIYWPLSSEDGSLTYWVYYPKLNQNTLHSLILKLRDENERLHSQIASTTDKTQQTLLRGRQQQVEGMMEDLNNIINAGYKPNHDDGVPVTSCPLVKLIAHRGWKQECTANWEDLQKGEYDWSHLAMSMFPARVIQKAKKDWCLALTHGLEHLCENKPKEKKPRKKKVDATEQMLDL